MTQISNQCKWILFSVVSLSVVLFTVLFHSLSTKSKCTEPNHLRFRETGQCFEKEVQGPCPDGLIFAENDHMSHFGACSCPYMRSNRTLVYHEEKCYYIFTQAYCPDGYWLNVTAEGTERGKPICEKSQCLLHSMNSFVGDIRSNIDGDANLNMKDQINELASKTNVTELVPIKGRHCAKLGYHREGCPEGSVIRFHKNYVLPSCFEPPPPDKKLGKSFAAIGVGAYISCPSGSARAITGMCQPYFDFDFDY